MPFEQVQPSSMVSQIVDQVIEIIRSNRFSVGDRLPSERQLAEMVGASRPTVREALTTLSAVGVLEIRRGVGTFVRTVDVTGTLGTRLSNYLASGMNPIDALEIRSLLEPGFAALAAGRADNSQLRRIEASLRISEERAAVGELYLAADKEFHFAIAAATGNPLSEQTLGPLLEIWFSGDTEASTATMRAPGRLTKYHEQHMRIYQVINDGDAERAFDEMAKHFRSIEADFRTVDT